MAKATKQIIVLKTPNIFYSNTYEVVTTIFFYKNNIQNKNFAIQKELKNKTDKKNHLKLSHLQQLCSTH